MRNPIQELQAEELEKEEICRDILNSTIQCYNVVLFSQT